MFFDRYDDDGAQKLLNEWQPAGQGPLVQIAGAGQTPVVVTTAVNETYTGVSGD